MVGGTADCRVDFLESMVGGMVAVGFMKSLVPGSIALLAVGWLERVEFLVSGGLAARLVSVLVGCLGGARPCLRRKPCFI